MLTLKVKAGETLVIGDASSLDCCVVRIDAVAPGSCGGQQKAIITFHAPESVRISRLDHALSRLALLDQQVSQTLQQYLESRRPAIRNRCRKQRRKD